jgi:hypothetical protein
MTGGWPDLDRACPGGHLGSPNAFTPWRSCFDVVATTDELQIVDRRTVTPVAAEHHHGLKGELRPKRNHHVSAEQSPPARRRTPRACGATPSRSRQASRVERYCGSGGSGAYGGRPSGACDPLRSKSCERVHRATPGSLKKSCRTAWSHLHKLVGLAACGRNPLVLAVDRLEYSSLHWRSWSVCSRSRCRCARHGRLRSAHQRVRCAVSDAPERNRHGHDRRCGGCEDRDEVRHDGGLAWRATKSSGLTTG